MTVARLLLSAGALLVIAAASGCAPDPQDVDDRASGVEAVDVGDLGDVLVDGKGAVLYVFEPDNAETVSCTFTCATNWPPLVAPEGSSVTAGAGVDPDLFGTTPNPSGGEVVTYNGWPLYRYAADKQPGDHLGQDRYLNGGDWFVMTPSGTPLRP